MSPRAGRRRSWTGVILGAAAAGLALGAVLVWPDDSSTPAAHDLPPPPPSGLDVPRPAELERERYVSYWTTLRRRAVARRAPDRRARPVARLSTRTPEGTDNALLVLRRVRDDRGRVWLRVRLAVLPNGSTGWLPRRAVGGYRTVRTRLVVNLRRRRATLLRDGRRVFRAAVGVGRRQWPTPRGRFYIRNKLVRYESRFYGPLAFGTSARSAVLTDWPDGGFVGIHGTDRPDLIPGRVSHGCIRMRNPDIVRLGRLMPVGTPLTIT
jgi:lipoprotein-anchoring transpeptidase ErfK/SrfK